jgi:hypothetical protein
MQTQGVDTGALLRRVAPLWLAWVLLAATTVWMGVGYLSASGGGGLLDVSQTSEIGGDGTWQLEPVGQVSRLTQLSIGLLLGFGNFGVTFELPLLCLVGAAGVAVLWVGHGRRDWVRAVAATGAVISLGLGLTGLGVVLSRESLRTTFSSVGLDGMTSFDSQFTAWGMAGLFGVILCWAFLRIGFGPVPLRPATPPETPEPITEPPPEQASEQTPEGGGATAGSRPLAAPDSMPQGWDTRPELPPDFLAPQAGTSLFERPAPRAGGSSADSGAASGREDSSADEVEVDTLSAYRRPPGS